jgi:choline dehydrogenase-like flavoprotein
MFDLISVQFSNIDLSFTIVRANAFVMRVPYPVPVQTSFETMFDLPAVFHPAGTYQMSSDSSAVLDPELRVREVQGLRVMGASVIPKITSKLSMRPH